MAQCYTWYDLLEQIINGKPSHVKSLLEAPTENFDLDERDASGRTLLDYCTYRLVSFSDFTPDMISPNNIDRLATHLHKALLLLKHGADPNLADKRGWTIIHQCAVNGDITFLQLCVYFGANVKLYNLEGQQPLDLALLKKHAHIVRYLEVQSLSLKFQCRRVIRDTMGTRTYRRINELPLPPSLKFFVNYGNPFPGSTLPVFVPRPWTEEEIKSEKASKLEVIEFIENNASHEFIEEKQLRIKDQISVEELAAMFESLYFWEAFKNIDYEEPLARKPRYSLELRVNKEVEIVEPQTDFSNIFRRLRRK